MALTIARTLSPDGMAMSTFASVLILLGWTPVSRMDNPAATSDAFCKPSRNIAAAVPESGQSCRRMELADHRLAMVSCGPGHERDGPVVWSDVCAVVDARLTEHGVLVQCALLLGQMLELRTHVVVAFGRFENWHNLLCMFVQKVDVNLREEQSSEYRVDPPAGPAVRIWSEQVRDGQSANRAKNSCSHVDMCSLSMCLRNVAYTDRMTRSKCWLYRRTSTSALVPPATFTCG